MRDDYHGLHTLHASTWCYALPSILLLHAADRRCLTRENRNQNQIICRKSNWNRSKLKIGNRNSTKVMATTFGDCEKLLMKDYLYLLCILAFKEDNYWPILCRNYVSIVWLHQTQTSGKLSSSVWLLHNNAPVHNSLVVLQAVRDCGFLLLNHPAYSEDLAPSDCYQKS